MSWDIDHALCSVAYGEDILTKAELERAILISIEKNDKVNKN